jgi:hypothetical protein
MSIKELSKEQVERIIWALVHEGWILRRDVPKACADAFKRIHASKVESMPTEEQVENFIKDQEEEEGRT